MALFRIAVSPSATGGGQIVLAADAQKATMELLGTTDESTVAYIDDELLSEYEDSEEAEPSDEREEDAPEAPEPEALYYYGNHLVADPNIRGRLHFRNGSANRPNDPCGQMYRRWVQLRPGSRIDPFRQCSGFYGYQITIY
jgi:hypothetical protein